MRLKFLSAAIVFTMLVFSPDIASANQVDRTITNPILADGVALGSCHFFEDALAKSFAYGKLPKASQTQANSDLTLSEMNTLFGKMLKGFQLSAHYNHKYQPWVANALVLVGWSSGRQISSSAFTSANRNLFNWCRALHKSSGVG